MALTHILIGNTLVMVGSCSVIDPITESETPTDPTSLTFIRELPDDTILTYADGDPEVTHLAIGVNACTVVVEQAGRETWRLVTTGNCAGAGEAVVLVDPSAIT